MKKAFQNPGKISKEKVETFINFRISLEASKHKDKNYYFNLHIFLLLSSSTSIVQLLSDLKNLLGSFFQLPLHHFNNFFHFSLETNRFFIALIVRAGHLDKFVACLDFSLVEKAVESLRSHGYSFETREIIFMTSSAWEEHDKVVQWKKMKGKKTIEMTKCDKI